MIITIEHTTHYTYSEAVKQSTQFLRLTPSHHPTQQVLDWHIDLPYPATQTTDAYGNVLHVLTIDKPHQYIDIHVKGQVDINPLAAYSDHSHLSPLVYLRGTPHTQVDASILHFAQSYFSDPISIEALQAFSHAVLQKMPYTPGSTHVLDTAAHAFAQGSGVCQDHSHVFIAACRHFGLPARYVSGYIATHDTSHVSSHAWVEVWWQKAWHTFDITNQLTTPCQHVKLATGLDYLDACPVRGVRFGGGLETMTAHARVGLKNNTTFALDDIALNTHSYSASHKTHSSHLMFGGQQ